MDVVARQAAAIPFRHDDGGLRFCLVTTSSGRYWTFPKGIVERGDTTRETALKEALEEAGLHGSIVGETVGSYRQTKWGTEFTVDVFLMNVSQVDTSWEEQPVRRRRWCDASTAGRLLQGRPAASVFDEAVRLLQHHLPNPQT